MDEGIRILRSRDYSRVKKRESWWVELAGPSTVTKPTDAWIVGGSRFVETNTGDRYIYDEGTKLWNAAGAAEEAVSRITSLTETMLAGAGVIDVTGIPDYVSDVSEYPDFELTRTGWYVFARIDAPEGVEVTADTTVTGAEGYIATVGEDYVDVAVRFEVAAMSCTVAVNWGESVDTYVFRATDLAVRNLDYRTTFYVYDADEFVSWEYAIATDATFSADKAYFQIVDGAYVKQEVTPGDACPTAYYEHDYELTTDETFVEGKTYYTESDGMYTEAEVTAGEAVTENTYYVDVYTLTTDTAFVDGKTYYTLSGGTYTAAEVTVGADVLTLYYVHSKCIISGMARNITYKLDTVIDCPMEFILPTIEDETHGCWFEIRCIHAGEYSMTLTPPSSDVKIATEHTQKETKGINMIDLHYTYINGVKLWRFMNTHSSIPEATT